MALEPIEETLAVIIVSLLNTSLCHVTQNSFPTLLLWSLWSRTNGTFQIFSFWYKYFFNPSCSRFSFIFQPTFYVICCWSLCDTVASNSNACSSVHKTINQATCLISHILIFTQAIPEDVVLLIRGWGQVGFLIVAFVFLVSAWQRYATLRQPNSTRQPQITPHSDKPPSWPQLTWILPLTESKS